MFILYAIPIGLVAGFLAGGRLDQLGAVRFRLAPVALVALAVQIVLFSPLAGGAPTELVRAVYVAIDRRRPPRRSRQPRLTGVPLIVLGAALNLAAIVANGGAMPAGAGALAALGIDIAGHTGSVLVEHPALEPLTDIFATAALDAARQHLQHRRRPDRHRGCDRDRGRDATPGPA